MGLDWIRKFWLKVEYLHGDEDGKVERKIKKVRVR